MHTEPNRSEALNIFSRVHLLCSFVMPGRALNADDRGEGGDGWVVCATLECARTYVKEERVAVSVCARRDSLL